MRVVTTPDEDRKLAALQQRMRAMDAVVRARPPTKLAVRMAADLAALEVLSRKGGRPDLVDAEVKASVGWVFNATEEEQRAYDALADEYNTILRAARDRTKAAAEQAEAAAGRTALRRAMCDNCFMVHRPNQQECD